MSHAHPDILLLTTANTLRDGSVDSGVATDLIKDWISILEHTDGVEPVTMSIQNLRDELNKAAPDVIKVKTLLDELSQYTAAYGRQATGDLALSLQKLSDSLQTFAHNLDQL